MKTLDATVFLEGHDKELERELFEKILCGEEIVRPVFVVCAPRVGSTLIYQALANVFGLTYFSNATNDLFSKTPALGLLRESKNKENKYLLSYFSQYGKTSGLRETSEASAIFGNWFGGGHPSESVSSDVKSVDAGLHMQRTFAASKVITGRDHVSKNPWNSFRIKSLASHFPEATFVWIRRSIDASAISDLENRIARGNPNEIWNSATTANYKDIQKRPYVEQVVLQQYYYSMSIKRALDGHEQSNVFEVWYEDLCATPRKVFAELCAGFEACDMAIGSPSLDVLDEIRPSKGVKNELPDDYQKILDFIKSDNRYSSMLHQA